MIISGGLREVKTLAQDHTASNKFESRSVSLQCASKGCACTDYTNLVSVPGRLRSREREMLMGGHDAGLSPGGRAGAREQCRLHFTGGQRLAPSKVYFPISRSICILFQILWELLIVLHSKQDGGWGREPQMIISRPRYFPFYLQSSQCTPSQAGGHCCSHFPREANKNLRRLALENLITAPSRFLTTLKKLLHLPSSLAPHAHLHPCPGLFFSGELVTTRHFNTYLYVNLFVVYLFYFFFFLQVPRRYYSCACFYRWRN